MLLCPFDAADAGVGLGHHDEAVTLEQPARDLPEVAVVVDEEHPTRHEAIVPANASLRSVAGPTLSPR